MRVEVLVVDVNLPGISGLELLTLLRADPDWREPPVILMSARADQPEIAQAVSQGDVARFIAKPSTWTSRRRRARGGRLHRRRRPQVTPAGPRPSQAPSRA